MSEQGTVGSPCIGICRLDPQALCVGCRRSLDEIVEWPRASDPRRRVILAEIVHRSAAFAPATPTCASTPTCKE